MSKLQLNSDNDATIISNKNSNITLSGTEEVLINNAGTLEKTTVQDIANLGGGGSVSYIIIQDQKASGSSGGTTIATTWTKRDLNTLVRNDNSIASLSSNEIVLPSGTYEFNISSTFGRSNIAAIRLYNETDNTEILRSPNTGSDDTVENTPASMSGVFTITATKNISVQYYSVWGIADGLGVALNSGSNEIYTTIFLKKVS